MSQRVICPHCDGSGTVDIDIADARGEHVSVAEECWECLAQGHLYLEQMRLSDLVEADLLWTNGQAVDDDAIALAIAGCLNFDTDCPRTLRRAIELLSEQLVAVEQSCAA